MDPTGELMNEIPVTGAIAEYHGQRFRILFSNNDSLALCAGLDVDIPDAVERGESPAGPGHYDPWAKVPRSALDGVVQVSVSATLAGHTVYLRRRLPDGRIGIEFVGPPGVARSRPPARIGRGPVHGLDRSRRSRRLDRYLRQGDVSGLTRISAWSRHSKAHL
jgi:hypothetical protein